MKNRSKHMDFIRALAIILVIFCHCCETVYDLDSTNAALIYYPTTLIVYLFFTMGRLGVPLFLLLTGYLFLDRDYDNESAKLFLKKNWIGIIIASEIWVIINYVYSNWYYGSDFSFEILIKDVLFMKNHEMSHLWYVPMIIGMYALIPFVASALQKFEDRFVFYLALFYLVICFIIPIVDIILKICGMEGCYTMLSIGFSGGCYGIYFVLGYLLKRNYIKNISSLRLVIAMISSFIMIVLIQCMAASHQVYYKVWYDNGLLLVCGVCIFELLRRLKFVPFYGIVKNIAYYSFAIFLVHNIVLLTCYKLMVHYLQLGRYLMVPVYTVITLIITYLVVVIIGKLPLVGKKCLYLK